MTEDIVQHACATGWRTHKDVEKSATRAWTVLRLCTGREEETRGIEAVGRDDVEGAARLLEEGGLSGATVNRYIAAFLSAWRIAHESGFVDNVPPKFEWRKEGKGRERFPTRAEVALMLRTLRKQSDISAWLTRFLYRTGARLGEALAAQTEDITLYAHSAMSVCLADSKSGRPRKILVPSCYGFFLRRMMTMEGRERLFSIAPSTFSAYWRQAREAAGLGDWFVPHTLRHACASEMVRAGVPLTTVARTLGHESTRTTERYTHATDDDVLEALAAR